MTSTLSWRTTPVDLDNLDVIEGTYDTLTVLEDQRPLPVKQAETLGGSRAV